MKLVIFALLLITTLIITKANSVDENYILDAMKGRATKEIFKAYHFLFKKDYELDTEEGVKRYKIFKENLKWCEKKNAELGSKAYGINPFSDLTNEEFREMYLMKETQLKSSSGNIYQENLTGEEKNIDWRSHMNPARDQKDCGSCWSFSTIASIEGNYKIQLGKQLTLSEQYLINCDNTDNGCNGGQGHKAMTWMQSHGAVNLSDAPYAARSTFCTYSNWNDSNTFNVVKGYKECGSSSAGGCDKSLWLELLSKGPMLVYVDSSDAAWQNYKPTANSMDPLVPGFCSSTNHAVTAIGVQYINGVEYLLIRNSWSEKWGINGNFLLPSNKHCGILDYAVQPIVQQAGTPLPPVKCPNFYSGCEQSGQKTSDCSGVGDFNSSIGGPAKGWTNTGTDVASMVFYDQPNCQGKSIYVSKETQCFERLPYFPFKSFSSASINLPNIPQQCIMLHEGTCRAGDSTLICMDIKDTSKVNLDLSKIKIGSISFKSYGVKNVMFFPEPNMGGIGVSINQSLLDLTNQGDLLQAIKTAKSIAINNIRS